MQPTLKIFDLEVRDDAVIVKPHGDGNSFRYKDLHVEANAIRGMMMKPEHKHLIMNLESMNYFGSEFIGSMVSMLRETRARGGKPCFCCANDQMYQVLNNMSLYRLWPHFPSLEEALTYVHTPPETA